jgi:hypothetical protein
MNKEILNIASSFTSSFFLMVFYILMMMGTAMFVQMLCMFYL